MFDFYFLSGKVFDLACPNLFLVCFIWASSSSSSLGINRINLCHLGGLTQTHSELLS